MEDVGGAPKIEYPGRDDAKPAGQQDQRQQSERRGDDIAIGGAFGESRRQIGGHDAGDQERQADEAERMKHEQRPQGFVAASAAQFRQDQASGDCTPGNETEDDADKKAHLRPHDRSSGGLSRIVSLAVSDARVALPNFYNVAVRIANVAARLAVLGFWLRDELGSSLSP